MFSYWKFSHSFVEICGVYDDKAFFSLTGYEFRNIATHSVQILPLLKLLMRIFHYFTYNFTQLYRFLRLINAKNTLKFDNFLRFVTERNASNVFYVAQLPAHSILSMLWFTLLSFYTSMLSPIQPYCLNRCLYIKCQSEFDACDVVNRANRLNKQSPPVECVYVSVSM